MKHKYKILILLPLALCLALLAGSPALASGSGGSGVSEAIEGTWNEASGEIRTVVDNVVFPAIDMILVIFLFAKLAMAYFDYRTKGHFEWSGPAILFACLVFTLTAPLYIWTILE